MRSRLRGNRGQLSLLVMLGGSLMAASAAAQSAVPPQDRPTVKLPAKEIDQRWVKASAKYDKERNTILATVDKVANAGPFAPDWQTLATYDVPEWYRDAKFGIFIHWGVYSVPAFGSEWYPREMYTEGSEVNKHHVATYGPLSAFGYKDFIPKFTAEKFDPGAWAKLFKAAGAMYVVPVFEHHDGFQMYDSDLSDWTAKKMGPHRDLDGDLAKAVRAEGMHLGASSHRIEHDWFLGVGRAQDSDVNDPKYAAFYGPAHTRVDSGNDALADDWTYVSKEYGDDWVARNAEIVQKYHPDLIFFDWWIGQPSVRPYLAKFAAYYYNESKKQGPVGIINYKFVDMAKHSGVLDIERGQLAGIQALPWQTDTSVSNRSWGYIDNDTFKTPAFIVQQLVDVVSKNGNLLMNIGPKSDGTIPQPVQQVLLDVGAWLKVNGDAIYGTRPWTTYGEGPTKVAEGSFHDVDTQAYTAKDFRFTTKGGMLYAIEMAQPEHGEAIVTSLSSGVAGARAVRSVSLLGSTAPLAFTQKPDGLHITVPQPVAPQYAYSYRIDFGDAAR